MARRVFFSFHYERDSWRAAQVRNCNMLQSDDQFGFIDAAEWQSIESQGDEAIERWISDQMHYTSVTAVLTGTQTAGRPWVRHEVVESWSRGNGIVGIRIHNIKDKNSAIDVAGPNPFDLFKLPDGALLSSVCKTYDWVLDEGRANLGPWIEEAFEIRTKRGPDEEILEVNGRVERVSFARAATVSSGFVPRAPWSAINVEK